MSCLWKQFPNKMVHQKTLAKKAQTFFWFQVPDPTFRTAFTKAKTSTYGHFVQ